MSTKYATKHGQPTNENDLQDQLRQQFCFTTPAKDILISPIPQTELRVQSSSSAIIDRPPYTLQSRGSTVLHPEREIPNVQLYLKMQAAQRAIEAKANQLDWIGAMVADFAEAGIGYVIRYEHADIYYSVETGAHAVNGDIRAKYNLLGAATSVLRLPVTGETGTPDGIGRYNHFQGGSIYWTQNTGPMMVRGAIRDMWASRGWELGFGYPVSDPHRKRFLNPIGKPEEYSSTFQKGAIYSKGNATAEAFIAELLPDELANVVRKTFDKALKEADEDLGIEGGVNILNVSDWGFDFWASRKRVITFEIQGFYSNGIPTIPDPTFRLELQFLFGLTRATPSNLIAEDEDSIDKMFVIYLNRPPYISTSGVGHGTLFDRLNEELPKKFPFAVRTIPAEALLMDLLVTPQGGLQFLLEPGVDFPGSGSHRRDIFQSQLNLLVEE